MPKHARSFDLALPPKDPREPTYRWLYRVIREEILAGRLRPGSRLPSTRDLASRYGLARATIITTFDILKSEGYLHGSIGSGTFVAGVLPDEVLQSRMAPSSALDGFPHRRLSPYASAVRVSPNAGSHTPRAFRANVPAVDLFPLKTWAALSARHARTLSTDMLMGCEPEGLRSLRDAIAEYLNTWRGVRCTADQVIIVSGVLEALDLCARLFLSPGDRVCVEDPGYPDAALVLEAMGAQIVPTPIDREGLQIDETRLAETRMVYVTPGHQAPLGVTMSLNRRLSLLELAHRSGAVIFEDDYDSEYRYSTRPVPALQGLDQHGNVIFAGSFSKVLFPSLRLGYIVTPLDLVEAFRAARSQTVRHAQILDQLTLRDFIDQGHFARHLRRMREVYVERLGTLLDETRQHLAGLLEISPIEAGLQTIGWLNGDIDARTVAEAASERGLIVTPLDMYARSAQVKNGLLLGFASICPDDIRTGVRKLAPVLGSLASEPH